MYNLVEVKSILFSIPQAQYISNNHPKEGKSIEEAEF